jgi:transposase
MILGELPLWTHKAVLRDPDMRVTDVANRYGVGRATIYKHVGAVAPQVGGGSHCIGRGARQKLAVRQA